MTELDYAEKQFNEKKAEIEGKCKESIETIKGWLTEYNTISAQNFCEVFQNRYEYHINSVEIMNADKGSENRPPYLQIMFTFEDNTTLFMYVDMK